jgi:hypothetical protein
MRRATSLREHAQRGGAFVSDVGDGVSSPGGLSDLEQAPIGRAGVEVLAGPEGQGPHRALADESQPVQRRDRVRATSALAEEPVHEQQAPPVRQGIGDESRQVVQVAREAAVGLDSQQQMPRRELEAARQGLGGVFEDDLAAIVGQGAEHPVLAPALEMDVELLYQGLRLAAGWRTRWRWAA